MRCGCARPAFPSGFDETDGALALAALLASSREHVHRYPGRRPADDWPGRRYKDHDVAAGGRRDARRPGRGHHAGRRGWRRLCAAQGLASAVSGLAVAAVPRRTACRQLGGMTGDVFGALIELSTATVLLVAVLSG